MAIYASKQDLLERDESALWNLAINRSDDTLNETAIDDALAQADDEINSYLSRRFQMPLAQVPSLLNKLAITITFYWLADRDNQATDLMTDRYDRALKTLKEIAAGQRELGLATADAAAEGTVGKVELIQDGERLFTRSKLGGVL